MGHVYDPQQQSHTIFVLAPASPGVAAQYFSRNVDRTVMSTFLFLLKTHIRRRPHSQKTSTCHKRTHAPERWLLHATTVFSLNHIPSKRNFRQKEISVKKKFKLWYCWRADRVGKPKAKPSASGSLSAVMIGTSGFGGACIFSRTSSGSVSATCARLSPQRAYRDGLKAWNRLVKRNSVWWKGESNMFQDGGQHVSRWWSDTQALEKCWL